MATTDIDARVTHLEGEMRGTQQIAEALFKLSDRMHDDMTAMRQEFRTDMTAMRQEFRTDMTALRSELKDDIRAGRWERVGIIVAVIAGCALISASIYFS